MLSGVVAGKTAICTVGHEGKGLHYRGYAIADLAEYASYEEVAHLLLYGHLPDAEELDSFRRRLMGHRWIPEELKATLRRVTLDGQADGCPAHRLLRAGMSRAGGILRAAAPDR